jgi:hypothetical protein
MRSREIDRFRIFFGRRSISPANAEGKPAVC